MFQIRLADNPSASVRCEDCVIGECRNEICFERGAATPSRALTLGVSVGIQVFLAGKFFLTFKKQFALFQSPKLASLWGSGQYPLGECATWCRPSRRTRQGGARGFFFRL